MEADEETHENELPFMEIRACNSGLARERSNHDFDKPILTVLLREFNFSNSLILILVETLRVACKHKTNEFLSFM